MLRLATALSALFAGTWIAGYIAIVAPVILKWMPPGQQNASFIFWAAAGWLFFALIAIVNTYSASQYFKIARPLLAIILPILCVCMCLFQALGYQATYAVRDSSEQRNKLHENTVQYKKQDEIFQVAHKDSERYIGLLLFCLLFNVGINLTANAFYTDPVKRIED